MSAGRRGRRRRPVARSRGSRPRIGILGGSFDPVHVGHLILAEEALGRLRLDRLILLPAGRPAHKRSRALAPAKHRLAMLRLAARGHPKLRVSSVEADRSGISFTVRTLEAMTRAEPASWYFVMGQDSLADFASWREPEAILRMARLAVVPRGRGGPARALRGSLAVARAALSAAARRRRVVLLPMPAVAISSTEIRRRLRSGAPVRHWMPDSVLAYVRRHGLYGSRRR